MRKKLAAARRALRENRGSGIVLVLVCMLCVSIMGVMVLYLSYTGMMMKVAERQGKADFYDASAAVDEIRAGVQKAVSDSVAQAYKKVLINYSNPDFMGSDMTEKFQEEFRTELYRWEDAAGTALFPSGSARYDAAVLAEFVSNAQAQVSGAGTAVYDTVSKQVVLQGVHVVYTNAKKGYTSEVTTDIAVGMPDFSYVISQYSISGLPAFALVAKEKLTEEGESQLKINGSAYAGAIDLQGIGSLIISNGPMVCKGEASAAGSALSGSSARLILEDSASLWAKRIKVGAGSSVRLSGSTYVQDDLDLAGYQASAVLSGSYYGFGNSPVKADESSAILVNGRDTSLDLSGLSRLMLAGHSFVSNPNAPTPAANSDVLMGESFSVRGNQRAYLAPVSCLSGVSSNPCIYNLSSPPAAALKTDVPIWAGKTLADYGAKLKEVHMNYPGATGQQIVYYFMTFPATAQANAYFRDYFANNTAEIRRYLEEYTQMLSPAAARSAGYSVKKNADGTYSLVTPVSEDSFTTSSTQLSATFRQLTTSLFERGSSAADNPYDYFVNTEAVNGLSDTRTEFKDSDGNIVAEIVKGDCSTSGIPDTVCVLITTGNVLVNSEFNGFILSGGTIDMQASVLADETQVTSAFKATNGDGTTLGSFLRSGISGTTPGGGTDTSSWNLSQLVTYRNWTKD